MGDLLIRNVDEHVLQQLKGEAEINGASLRSGARKALARETPLPSDGVKAVFEELDRAWGDRPPS